ncbi:MAG: hypothetical protein ABIJ48_10560 [Actinomycetota bacterium]
MALAVASALPAFADESHATGLERAREVAAKGVLTAKGLADHPDAERVTGRERAAEAIAAGLERGNGNGNGFGRGNSAAVLEILANGGSPSEIAGEHGRAVREMVHAYNELRKQSG